MYFSRFFFFFLCPHGRRRWRGLFPAVHLHQHPGRGEPSFDDALAALMWGRVKVFLVVLIALRYCQLCCSRLRKPCQGFLVDKIHLSALTPTRPTPSLGFCACQPLLQPSLAQSTYHPVHVNTCRCHSLAQFDPCVPTGASTLSILVHLQT